MRNKTERLAVVKESKDLAIAQYNLMKANHTDHLKRLNDNIAKIEAEEDEQ